MSRASDITKAGPLTFMGMASQVIPLLVFLGHTWVYADTDDCQCLHPAQCRCDADCPGAQCLGGACLIPPTRNLQNAYGGPAEVDCIEQAGSPSSLKRSSCVIEGEVVDLLENPMGYEAASNLTIRVLRLEDVMDGRFDQALATAELDNKNGFGTYRLRDVPTHVELVLEVRPKDADRSGLVMTTYTFGVRIIPEACQLGVFRLFAAVASISEYQQLSAFPQSGLQVDRGKGLLLGTVRECDDFHLRNATAGLSLAHEQLAYLDGPLPILAAGETTDRGMFVACNVSPGAGLAVAAVLENAKVVLLGAQPVRVFADRVSLVLFDISRSAPL